MDGSIELSAEERKVLLAAYRCGKDVRAARQAPQIRPDSSATGWLTTRPSDGRLGERKSLAGPEITCGTRRCVDHFVVFGERHLRHIVSEYVKFHNEDRPHQGVGNTRLRVIGAKEPREENADGEIVCAARLGGLLKHYCRKAA